MRYLLCKEIELGLAGTEALPAEEAIRILVNSYKSSEMNQQVQKEVVVLSKKVFFMTY